jgi:multidrug efflux pump subunit AcrA (membrane-fusion protein)
VLHVYKRAGESVDGTTATPIAEVADLTVLEVRAQVSPATLVRLRDNMTASVHAAGLDAALPGSIARVSPAVDTTTLLGTVRIRLEPLTAAALTPAATPATDDGDKPGPAPTPPVGSAATVVISLSRHAGIIVPATALRRSAVGTDEIVVCDKGIAKVREVEIGHRGESGVEVAKGVVAGEQVVTDHALGLEDGQALAPAAPAAARKP